MHVACKAKYGLWNLIGKDISYYVELSVNVCMRASVCVCVCVCVCVSLSVSVSECIYTNYNYYN